jgi:hypothetical protein
MRLRVSLLLLAPALLFAADPGTFRVLSESPGAWPDVLSAVGWQPRAAGPAQILVLRSGAAGSPEWTTRVEQGTYLVLEGESPVAEMFGFIRGKESVRVLSVEDVHRPKLQIVWEKPAELPRFRIPAEAQVFARERWSGAPLIAGFRKGSGAVLWVAASLGKCGYERFPYVAQALTDLGLEPPLRSTRLWAFFDSSYRRRVDLDYFARRWQAGGIAALQVAAWHFYDRDPENEAYLRELIAACHRAGILVYAWLELPHVSEKFWNDHPEWREKTAVLQDAHLDWRKLMNLTSRDCFHEVEKGVRDLIGRFDWDGVNLAELYFESLEGMGNPSRFTPMNEDARRQFREAHGWDPLELFQNRKAAADQRLFLDFRAGLARRMQEEWLHVLDQVRRERPHLDLVLTHVDDRFDTGMREAIGADAARVLPLASRYRFTFLIEDPATVWNLGPQRYPEIARRYEPLTNQPGRLAIDINIVDRYQDVYPTRQQTGSELFQLVHLAAGSFSRVALYFENSLLAPDLPLLSSAAAVVRRVGRLGPKLAVESPSGVGIPWRGPAVVDGRPWPVTDDRTVWLPAGGHVVEQAPAGAAWRGRVVAFNGGLDFAQYLPDGRMELSYHSQPRALAVLDRPPRSCEIDGARADVPRAGPLTLMLPPGQHIVTIQVE